MLSLLIICCFAGGIGAIFQGMIGVGTGLIVIPLLTFLLPHYGFSSDIAIHIALATSMSAIVVNSISALISHHRLGNIYWSIFRQILAFSLLGSFLGAITASLLSGVFLQKFFGFFMLMLSGYMLFKKSARAIDTALPIVSFKILALGGTLAGFISSIIGSGGGVLMVPFLRALQLPMRYAVGTSTLIGLPVASMGAATFIVAGLKEFPTTATTIGYLHWPALLAISFAGLTCAPLGAKFSKRVPTHILQRVFAVCMILVGLKMLL
jgi:uncharacterized membrane protein YfcA